MRRHFLSAIAATAVLLAIAAPSRSTFSPPQPLTSADWRGEQASVLFGDGSLLTVALVSTETPGAEVQVGQRRAGAAAGPPAAVARFGGAAGFLGDHATGAASGLGSNRSGDAVIAWIEGTTVTAVSRDRDGSLGKPESIAPGINAVAAMTPRGDAIVLFETNHGAVRAAVRPRAAARFQRPRTLTAAPRAIDASTLRSAGLRADNDGFVALWTSCVAVASHRFFSSCSRFRPSAARISSDGRTARVRTFDVPWDPWDTMQVVSSPTGEALALLSETRGSGGVVRVARAAMKRPFGAARVISRPARTAIRAVAASASGGGYVAWVERAADGSFRIVGADLSRRLNVGRPVALSPAFDKVILPRVRVGTDGSAAVFWPTAARGMQPPISWQLRSRRGHGDFAAPLTLAAVERLAVAIGSGGEVVAATAVRVPPEPGPVLAPGCHTRFELRSAIWTAGAAPAFRMLDSSCGGFAPMLAASRDGAVLAAWGRYEEGETWSLRTAVRQPHGDFGAATTAPGGVPLGLITMLLDGVHGAVVWSAFGDGGARLFASVDDDLVAGTP
jgi:hypothetical protein